MPAQFLDGFRFILVGEEHLALTHVRLQLMHQAAPEGGALRSTADGSARPSGFPSNANQRS